MPKQKITEDQLRRAYDSIPHMPGDEWVRRFAARVTLDCIKNHQKWQVVAQEKVQLASLVICALEMFEHEVERSPSAAVKRLVAALQLIVCLSLSEDKRQSRHNKLAHSWLEQLVEGAEDNPELIGMANSIRQAHLARPSGGR